VAILDEAFAGLAVMRQHAEANLRNARALFDSHLNAIFSQRGDGWVETTLAEAGKLQTGTTPKSSEAGMKGDFIPFIKPGDFVKDGSLDYHNEGLTEAGLTNSRLIAAGSALMVCIGATIGKAGFSTRQIATNQQINSFTPNSGIDGKFVFYQMLTDRFQDAVMHSSGQATLPIINKSKWGALSISVPKRKGEQVSIVESLDALMVEIGNLESLYRQKLTAIDELKQSILHRAFSGQLTGEAIAA
jgi:type I restriction enzyme S subunit